MKKNLRAVKIGHGAYGGANALTMCNSKSAAVRELRARGFTRNRARDIVNDVCSRPNGYATPECDYQITEVRAMNTNEAWEGY